MAEDNKQRRVVKKPSETVRERAAKTASIQPKKRRIRKTAGTASKPFRAIGRGIAKAARPFRFLLAPFKTKPARFVGRLLAKVLLINYIRNSWSELRQVEWPDRRTTIKLTLAVFMFAFAFAILIGVVDLGLDKLFKKLLLQ